jgi:hypothetical protein
MQIVANSTSYDKFKLTIGLDPRQHYNFNSAFNIVIILKFGHLCINGRISIKSLTVPNTGKDNHDNVAF